MDLGLIAQLERDHRQMLAIVERAEALVRARAPEWRNEVGALLAARAAVIEEHVAIEERDIYPALASILPPEIGSLEALMQEHATESALATMLAADLASDRALDALASAQDLRAVLEDHIRKEESVIFPLLRRLHGREG